MVREYALPDYVFTWRTFVGNIKTKLGVESTESAKGVYDKGIRLVQEVLCY